MSPLAHVITASLPDELLATLCPRPLAIRDLAADFGRSQQDIRVALGELALRGIEVNTCRHDGHHACYIVSRHWERAREAAEAFWEREHSEQVA